MDPERDESNTTLTSKPLAAHDLELSAQLTDTPTRSAMLTQFGFILRCLSSLLFAHVLFEQRSIDNLRDAATRGTIVYVIQVRSLFDYLYFNYAFIRHELPLARFANDVSTRKFQGIFGIIAALFKRKLKATPEQQVEALVAHREPVFLFLQRPLQNPEQRLSFSQKYLFRLVRTQKRMDTPIYVVPLVLFWERRPEPEHISFLNDIFGTGQSPGLFRKAIGVFQTVWQSFFNLGQPIAQVSEAIDLIDFLSQYPNAGSADASELLRERLLEQFQQERQVFLGPTGQSSQETFRSITSRPEILLAVQETARHEKITEDKAQARVHKYFKEIAAEQSLFMLKIFSLFLGLVWYRIYDGFEVDEEGLERVREAGKSGCLILIPSHKSHIDYLIISYLFYHYGLMPPHIAAGANLSFFPIGTLFRRAGAFFIRRSFHGERLYPLVFREYLIQLMRQGYPIEFFIEGTRSRTGKLIKPRYGMLDMIVRAQAQGRVERIQIVPISVGYEKIVEESSYTHELLGGEKKKESFSGLLRTPKFLTSRYGRLNVQFGAPIDLSTYLERYSITLPKTQEQQPKETKDLLNTLTVRLGHRIIYEINNVTAVTPTALTAAVMLNNTGRHIERQRFLNDVGFVLRFLRQPERRARLAKTLTDSIAKAQGLLGALQLIDPGNNLERAQTHSHTAIHKDAHHMLEERLGDAVASILDQAIEMFVDRKQILVTHSEEDHHDEADRQEIFYHIPDKARVDISFYRNNIIHLFVPEALLACAIWRFQSNEVDYEQLRDETHFLSKLFKYEWIYEERAEFENVFLRTLLYFERSGWIRFAQDDSILDTTDGDIKAKESEITGRIILTKDHPTELLFLRRILITFLEAYAFMASQLDELIHQEHDRNDWIKSSLKKGKAAFLKGDIRFLESLSKPTFTNTHRLFVDWGVLTESEERTYQVHPDWRDGDRLKTLQEHLHELVYQDDEENAQPRLTPDQDKSQNMIKVRT